MAHQRAPGSTVLYKQFNKESHASTLGESMIFQEDQQGIIRSAPSTPLQPQRIRSFLPYATN